ncbi:MULTISPECIES: hypothetical protein [Burkholderiaceae]|nr:MULTISPECIES: hypothetical protein [Burkholderiaceae]SIT68983.1 hypothetical protein SAMN04487769_1418 [Burkholderia sp. b14]
MNSSKLIKELRMMLKEMPAQRFWALWIVALCFGIGYIVQAIRWW